MTKILTGKAGRAALAALFLTGGYCAAETIEKTVATVNGEPIIFSTYKKNVESVEARYREAIPDFFSQKDAVQQIENKVLDQMIDDVLMFQAAEKAGLKVRDREIDSGMEEIRKRFMTDPAGNPLTEKEADAAFQKELSQQGLTIEKHRENIRRSLLARKLVDRDIRAKLQPPTEEEAKKLFNEVLSVVKTGTDTIKNLPEDKQQEILGLAQGVKEVSAERVRLRHIMLRTTKAMTPEEKKKVEAKIADIKKQLDAGEDFATLAAKYSEDKESASRGGDIGYLTRGIMPPSFENAAFDGKVGAVVGPVETDFGIHLLRIEEHKAAQTPSFDELKDRLAQYMMGIKLNQAIVDYVKQLRDKATIKINKQEVKKA